MKNLKRMMAWLLAVTMLVSGVDYVQAADVAPAQNEMLMAEVSNGDGSAVVISENIPKLTGATEDGSDVTDGDVSEGCISEGDVAEDVVVREVNSEANVLGSGEMHGITWKVTSDGVIYIGGKDTDAVATKIKYTEIPWYPYCDRITKAVVTAEDVKSTRYWFHNCTKLAEVDFKEFDTSSVTDMMGMFAICRSLTELDLSDFNTTNVEDMDSMFYYCDALVDLDIGGFDTSSVVDMEGMFMGCSRLSELNLDSFDTSKVRSMKDMFSLCYRLALLNISHFDTSSVIDMSYMFSHCYYLTEVDVSGFETGNVRDMSGMFEHCTLLRKIDVSGFDTSNVESMYTMFYECSSLTQVDVSGFCTENVVSMESMFDFCSSLSSLDVSGFDTSKVTRMTRMFAECYKLSFLDVSGFDTANVRSMGGMFSGCQYLYNVDVSHFNTHNVVYMSNMFSGCHVLKTLDVSSFDTSNVQNMDYMFKNCYNLTALDLSSFNTSNVTNMSEMFSECRSLSRLDLSQFDCSKLSNGKDMLSGLDSLCMLKCMPNLQVDVEVPQKLTDENGTVYDTYLPKNLSEGIWLYADVIESGTIDGLTWKITGNDVLYIGGQYNNVEGTVRTDWPWHEYADVVKSAMVDATGVKTTAYWFTGCTELQKIDLTAFSTAQVQTMQLMFKGCSKLETLDIGGFDMSKVTNADDMLTGCLCLQKVTTACNLSLNIELPSPMYEIHGREYTKYTQLPKNLASSIYLHKATSRGEIDGMEWYIIPNGELVISGRNTATTLPENAHWPWQSLTGAFDRVVIDAENVLSTAYWFDGCYNIISVDMTNFDTKTVQDMSYMFKDCSRLMEIDLSTLDVSGLTKATAMFDGCTGLSKIKVFKNLTMSVTLPRIMVDADMVAYQKFPMNSENDLILYATLFYGEQDGMDWYITKNRTLVITGKSTARVAKVSEEYPWHEYRAYFDKVTVDATNVFSMAYWFADCTRIHTLDMSNMNCSRVLRADCMLEGCNNLEIIHTPKYLLTDVDLPHAMISEDQKIYGKLPQNSGKSILLHKVVAYGKYCGLDWKLTGEGQLVISGRYAQPTANDSFWGTYASKVLSIDIQTSNVESTKNWFRNMGNLKTLDLANFDMSGVINAEGMFSGCRRLQKLRMPANLSVDVEVPKTMYNYLGEPQMDIFPKYQPEAEWYYAVSPVGEGEIHVSKVYPQTYTGKAIKPEIRIYDGANRLLDKKDFTITYKNNTKAASRDALDAKGKSIAPTITVKGKGNYTKAETITFDILAKDVADADVTVQELAAVAGKKVQTPVPKLTYKGKKLVNNKDFTVSYPDMSEENPDAYKVPGTYRVVVTGIGNFTGERTLTFTIGGTLMSKTKIAKIPGQTYTGAAIEPEIKVTHGRKVLVKDTDYVVSYANNVEIGKATVTVTGMGDYVGSRTATFQITGQSIAKAMVEGITAKTYNGKAQTQNITVMLKGQEKPLVKGTDYEVAYTKNINVGTANMTITGMGSYTGKIKKTFKINAYDLQVDEDKLLEGVPKDLTVTYEKGGSKPSLKLTYDGAVLAEKKDYTLSYANNTKVTTADTKKQPTITVKGKGNFKGSIKIPFSIVAKNLQDADKPVKISVPDVAYSKTKGKYISKPVLTDANGKRLTAGTDYEKAVVYSLADGTTLDKNSVVEAGQTVTVTVTGKGGYSGNISTTYRISQASFKSAKIQIAPQVYTGKEITLSEADFTSAKKGKDTLAYGEDFEIVEGSYKNNLKKGTASVTIRGKGNYGGEKTVKFKIVPKELIWFWRLFE